MGPNGYRSFILPSPAVAAAAYGMPEPGAMTEEKLRAQMEIMENCIAIMNFTDTTGTYDPDDSARMEKINRRGIPFPAHKSKRRRK